MNKKYLNLLGLANVAKGIVSGETLIKSIAANETKLVVIANDASANTKKKLLINVIFIMLIISLLMKILKPFQKQLEKIIALH